MTTTNNPQQLPTPQQFNPGVTRPKTMDVERPNGQSSLQGLETAHELSTMAGGEGQWFSTKWFSKNKLINPSIYQSIYLSNYLSTYVC